MRSHVHWFGLAAGFAVIAALSPSAARAHCDGLDGPVVAAARQALEARRVDPALAWVQPADEAEISRTFARTLAVRRLGGEAKELADLYFFETLVRVHRAGEGAPYTGLKPAGRDLGPAIPAADRALESGDVGAVVTLLGDRMHAGLEKRFHAALEARRQAKQDVAAGRRFVAAYVQYVHYVEGLFQAASADPRGHFEEAPKAEAHAH